MIDLFMIAQLTTTIRSTVIRNGSHCIDNRAAIEMNDALNQVIENADVVIVRSRRVFISRYDQASLL